MVQEGDAVGDGDAEFRGYVLVDDGVGDTPHDGIAVDVSRVDHRPPLAADPGVEPGPVLPDRGAVLVRFGEDAGIGLLAPAEPPGQAPVDVNIGLVRKFGAHRLDRLATTDEWGSINNIGRPVLPHEVLR